MPRRALPRMAAAAALLLACGAPAVALVNPRFQPRHLAERYQAVIAGRVTRVDEARSRIVVRVTQVCLGRFAPEEVALHVPKPEQGDDCLLDEVRPGSLLVAFAGKARRRHEGDVLIYSPGLQWHEAAAPDPKDMSRWTWKAALGDEMFGTFNGAVEQLVAMMDDLAAGVMYYPAVPFTRFKEALVLGTFGGPLRGVALVDLDGDGRLDVYACCAAGNRAVLQVAALTFADRTKALNLAGVRSASCGFADVDADGRADLLAGVVIHRGTRGGFAKTDWLPTAANEGVKAAAFVEINGDGYPDVVVSRHRGGLRAYLNPGARGPGAFADATSAAGLDRKECGAGGTGFFAPGDVNADGRTDLYYAAGSGLILVQDARGAFSPLPHKVPFDYKAAGSREPGLTGAGCFAALWRPDSWDLVAAADMHLVLLGRIGGKVANVARFGNEIRDCRTCQLATLAEDLNADGCVDLLTLSRRADAQNVYHTNRGYGSFMLDENYTSDYEPLPGKTYTVGAWGAAVGDVNGDGANDLLLGGTDGVLRLAINDTLARRKPGAHRTYHEKKRLATRILTVRVTGRVGVLGADIRLANAKGRLVGRRVIGSQVLTGCRSPDTVNLAVREPGAHTLTVRFSDGHARTWPVDLTGKKHLRLRAGREIP